MKVEGKSELKEPFASFFSSPCHSEQRNEKTKLNKSGRVTGAELLERELNRLGREED